MRDAPILFYDGRCARCRWGVRWLLRGELKKRGLERIGLRFAPLEGETAQDLLGAEFEAESVILWQSGQLWTEDRAVIEALKASGHSIFAFMLNAVPHALRRTIYRWCARHRRRNVPEDCPLDDSTLPCAGGPLLP